MVRRHAWLFPPRFGLIAAAIALLLATPASALDKVSLQLKWKHQFQFAGYYMALEKGFYRDAGLDVEIREGGPGIDAAKDLEDGKANFGVCTTSVLLAKAGRPPLVVLGVVFQHSAAVILTPSRSRITTPSELKSRWLMDTPGSDDLAAMLKHEGVDYSSLPRVKHDGDPRDLINGKADAMVAYATNEPFFLEQQGIPYRVFAPRTFGFDFYGDAFCTSAEQATAHPERTRAFRAATLKGWDYALAHKEETVDLILRRYPVTKSRDALLFEASRTEGLVQPKLVPLGSQTTERWQKIANAYRDLGMLADPKLPDRLVYEADDARMPLWRTLSLLAVGVLVLAIAAGFFARRRLIARLVRSGHKPKLSAVMAALFVCLSIPILIFILAYNHYRNAEAILAILQEQVTKSRHASVESVEVLMRGVSGMLGLLAEAVATQPAYFRTENSREALYRVLTSSNQIDAAYVSFEDGYHRVVTRVDDDRKRSDPKIPKDANWHSSYIDDFSVGAENRRRHRTFFDVWPHNIAQYSVPTTLDIRKLPGYAAARDSGSLFVTEPALNPDTGYPIISARVPITRDEEFLGCASVNITFDVLSQFLAAQRPSQNSLTLIADAINGEIIASSDKAKGVRVLDGKLQIARLENIEDDDVREAYRLHVQTSRDEIVFRSPRDGRELSASFARFTESYGHPWQWVTVTPTDDFVGQLKATNQQIIAIIAVLTAIELLLIFGLARRLSRPIESITRQLEFGRIAVVRAVRPARIDNPRDRPPAIGNNAVEQFAAVVFVVRTGRPGQGACEVRHSFEPRRRIAAADRPLLGSGRVFNPCRAVGPERSPATDLGLFRAGLARDFRREGHRRQVHRRRRHGILECAGGGPRSRAGCVSWRAAGRAADGSRQQDLGSGRKGRFSHPDRTEHRQFAGRQYRLVGPLQLHRHRRRRERRGAARGRQQAVRHLYLRQRQRA